jgi:hypothetical protein
MRLMNRKPGRGDRSDHSLCSQIVLFRFVQAASLVSGLFQATIMPPKFLFATLLFKEQFLAVGIGRASANDFLENGKAVFVAKENLSEK